MNVVISLVQGTTLLGDNNATNIAMTPVWSTVTVGGAADKWTTTLTASEIKDAGFGVAVAYYNSKTSPRNVYVNTIRILVDYTASTAVSSELPEWDKPALILSAF